MVGVYGLNCFSFTMTPLIQTGETHRSTAVEDLECVQLHYTHKLTVTF